MGNFSDGIKEGSFDDDWIVVKKKKNLKSFSALNQRFQKFLMAFFGLRFVNQGQRCSQIQKGFNASPFSGPNIAGSTSAGMNVHSILNDPEVRSLERLLRVKSKVEMRLPGRLLDPPSVSVPLNQAGDGCSLLRVKSADDGVLASTVPAVRVIAGENERITGLLEVATVSAAQVTAGTSARIADLLEVDTGLATDTIACDSERVTELLEVHTGLATDAIAGDEESRHVGGDAESHATAGESEEIIGLHVSHSPRVLPINLSNSSMDVACVGPASAVVALSATASSSSCPLASCVAGAVHARRTVTSCMR